jgi:omega-amidase
MMNKFRAGLVQFDIKKGQINTNMEKALLLLEKLVKENVKLAVLPEMFSCSFDNDNLKTHAQSFAGLTKTLQAFAFDHGIAIAGSLPETDNDQIFNTMIFIDSDGTIKGKYRKIHLFRLTNEHLHYTAGNKIMIVNSLLGRIGLMICYDLRFPELARAMFLKNADLIIVSAQWPESRRMHWETLIKARAIENQLFMICSNRTGKEDMLCFCGMSMIVDPMGNMLTKAGDEEACVSAEINFEEITKTRRLIPCIKDRHPEVYSEG